MTPVLAMQGALITAPLGAASMELTLTDPAEAEPWLARLLGAEVAVAALTGATALPRHPLLSRLALVLWARRWWPASPTLRIPALPEHLLALEAAALTAALDGALDEVEATPQEWFDLATTGPLDWAGAQPALATLAEFFDDLDDDERAARAHALAAQATAPAPGDFALAAGGPAPAAGAAALATGVASVDWARVPPGLLDAAEDTVRWSLLPAGSGAALHVAVLALPGAAAGILQAVVMTAEHRLALDLAPAPGSFAGQTPLPDGVARAMLESHPEVVVGAPGADPGEGATTAGARAAVVEQVRARSGGDDRLLAEQAIAW